jgi:hypothetical protein
VFLSQLFRRARLVNPAFQRRVADVVWRHAAAHDADADAADTDDAVGGGRHGTPWTSYGRSIGCSVS